MNKPRFSFYSAVLLMLFTLALAACSQQEPESAPSSLYEEAGRLERQKRYAEALEHYDRALAADTLKGFRREALEALCRKGRIEYLTGRYQAAFRTWESLETHAVAGKLDDSLRTAAGFDTARMYAELGRYGKAASVMESLGSGGQWQRYQIAVYRFRGGMIDQAARLYRELSLSEDPAIRMAALSGLLDCSLLSAASVSDTPEQLSAKIAAVSAQVMTMDAPSTVKIRSLRIAARSLLQLESQHRNASYLLFRALAIAQEERLSRLVPILQHESNAVIVRKPDTWRSVIEYFGANNMHYAKAAALCKLGECEELTPAERITALRNALSTCQNYGIPATATGYLKMVRDAGRQLDDLLIANGRFVELFDVSGQKDALEARSLLQASIREFRLPAGHEALQGEIIELTTGISGLLQRKIDMNEQGEGFRYAALVDRSITEKQGRLIGLIAEAGKIDPAVASKLQPEPLTLSTLRKRLHSGQALVRLFSGDSLTTAIMVSNREMQIETSPVTAGELKRRFGALRQRIGGGKADALLAEPERIGLNDSLLKTMSVRLAGYRHLIFVSDRPEPFHLLGRGELLGRGRKVSYLVSSNEIGASTQPSAGQDGAGDVAFFDAGDSGKAMIHKLFNPEARVFLAWKPLTDREVSRLKTALQKAPPTASSATGFLQQLGAESSTEASPSWLWLGAYGLD
ncbi:MAG: hypothetical protein JW764_08780 [Chlorobiaceae bacterium]|nr:hypothetical protein [Chlorobiaceae bacterium]